MKWGSLQIDLISDGTFWLDGGAMFGIVPRPIWEKVVRVDDRHRIPLGLNCLLIRWQGTTLLIDTGCGNKYTEKQKEIYRFDDRVCLLDELDHKGVTPDAVDLIVNTHLHFDHCGGNTLMADGALVPAFPNARYVVQLQELRDAEAANERTRGSYLPENWIPLRESGQLETVDGVYEILPGVILEPTPGHTQGHQSVRVVSDRRTLFYIADLCPTMAHVPLPWIMGYDLFPLTTLETRREVYSRALKENWLIFFEHDAGSPVGYLEESKGRFSCRPVSWKNFV